MARRERGLIGKLMVFVLTVLAVIGVIAMALSVINAFINPQHFIFTTVFGLAFWEIFLYNVLVFFLLMMLRSRCAWLSVIALLISIPGFNKSFSFGKKSEAPDSFRIMSYNVHIFNHVDGETKKEQFANQVMDLVRQQDPDILCCQEFRDFKSGVSRKKCIEDFAQAIGLPYFYYNRKSNYGGNVVFSKYPITKVDENSGFGQEHTYGVMVSVDAGDKGRFYVANVHLLSYRITDTEIDILTNHEQRQEGFDSLGRNILKKLNYAFQRRSDELQRVLNGMPEVDAPVLICGDFNEPPLSYNYQQMRKAGFVDTFTKAGRGIKPTYAGKLPLLRIDYIWADSQVAPLNYKRIRQKASDHYPILLDFFVNSINHTVTEPIKTSNTI